MKRTTIHIRSPQFEGMTECGRPAASLTNVREPEGWQAWSVDEARCRNCERGRVTTSRASRRAGNEE